MKYIPFQSINSTLDVSTKCSYCNLKVLQPLGFRNESTTSDDSSRVSVHASWRYGNCCIQNIPPRSASFKDGSTAIGRLIAISRCNYLTLQKHFHCFYCLLKFVNCKFRIVLELFSGYVYDPSKEYVHENFCNTVLFAQPRGSSPLFDCVIYAPPHSGKSTTMRKLRSPLSIGDTDDIMAWNQAFGILFTNIPTVLRSGKVRIAFIPSESTFISRLQERNIPDTNCYFDMLSTILTIDNVWVIDTDEYIDGLISAVGNHLEVQSIADRVRTEEYKSPRLLITVRWQTHQDCLPQLRLDEEESSARKRSSELRLDEEESSAGKKISSGSQDVGGPSNRN